MLACLSTLRWRLTLLYVGVMTLLLIGLGLFLASQAEAFLLDAEYQRLHDLGQPALYRPGRPGRPDDNLGRIAEQLPRVLFGTNVQGVVLNVQGQPVAPADDPNPALLAQIGSVQPTIPYQSLIDVGREATIIAAEPGAPHRTLFLLVPIRRESEAIGLVQMSTSLDEIDGLMGRFRALLLLGIGVTLGLALLAGLPLARLMLRPLDRLVETARRIADGDLGRRTELRHAEQEVAELAAAFDHMLDRIETAFRAREQSEARAKRFAADAAHELRSPLTAVGGYADVLLLGLRHDPGSAETILSSMRREIDRMSRLVTDLLTLARLDAGAGLESVQVDLSAIATEIGEQARLLSSGPEVRIRTAGPLLVRGDEDQLHRVVRNIVDNAVRYAPSDGRVEIEVDSAGAQARLCVHDTGPGIAPEHLPYIFERFYRPDPARSRETGSAGLGLAIVQAIVQAHGGSVSASSKPGEGASFTVLLPLVASPNQHSQENLIDLQSRTNERPLH